MIKILGVIFLSLLLSGCATTVSNEVQDELVKDNKIKIGMNFTEIKPLMAKYQQWSATLNNSNRYITIGDKNWETWSTFYYDGNIILLEQKEKSKQIGKLFVKALKNYKVIKIFNNNEHLDYYDFILQLPSLSDQDRNDYTIAKGIESNRINKVKKATVSEAEKKKERSEKEAKGLALMINKAKDTCKVLGFKEDTDKFSDCTLKLYSQEVENIVALKVAKQQKSVSSSSGTMTIYDPVRDRQNQIDRGMKMLSGGCTLGIDC
jgi:hypothetical protein